MEGGYCRRYPYPLPSTYMLTTEAAGIPLLQGDNTRPKDAAHTESLMMNRIHLKRAA
jgi:hypothetical protein